MLVGSAAGIVRTLSVEEKESYYQDSRRMGLLLGIASAGMPADYGSFAVYLVTKRGLAK